MKSILIGTVLAIFLFPGLLFSQTYEITETDIFGMEKIPRAENVTIYGISFNTSIEAVMKKFRRTESGFRTGARFPFVFKLAPGFDIHSTDKKTIHNLSLDVLFVRWMKGKTTEFFQYKNIDALKEFLTSTLGPPDYVFSSHDLIEMDMFFYLKGYVFLRIRTGLEGREGAQLFLELWPEENIKAKVKEMGLEKIKTPNQ